jgi:hypothetical protein
MKINKEGIKAKIKLWLKLILNWRFLVCFGLAWMITNGWSYVFIVLGTILHIAWMVFVGTTYLAFLWLPFTLEKVITVAIALFLVKVLFKKHSQELKEQIDAAIGKKTNEPDDRQTRSDGAQDEMHTAPEYDTHSKTGS